MAVEQGGNLRLDSMRQQRPRAVAQHLGQRIGECPWLAELENISLGHGVSLLRWRSGSFEHPHDTPPQPFMPSPTFANSSAPSVVSAIPNCGAAALASRRKPRLAGVSGWKSMPTRRTDGAICARIWTHFPPI